MKSTVTHSNVCIVGLGQLGGSLGFALMELGARRVHGIDQVDATIEQARVAGAIHDGTTSPADALAHADITFLCMPLTASIEFAKQNLEHFRFGSVVTDVGSVKGSVVRELRGLLFDQGVYFVGSHPMAGTEKCGLAHASADLFKDTVCFLTPTEDDDEEVLRILHDFWSNVGCNVLELQPGRHDLACAFASHMLHMTAAAATQSVLGCGDTEANQFTCAGGFRDHTRIASSDAHMWVEICKHNRDAILTALSSFDRHLTAIGNAIDASDWTALEQILQDAKNRRDAWFNGFGTKRGYKQ